MQEGAIRNNKPDKRLPPRLFTTDRSPTGRLNIYSKPDILPFIQHVLMNTKELQYIKNSCFGKLFELPARQCHVSCKLIHAFLTRQLLCEDNNTLWTVFRSDPIRFGLQEFGTITWLPCGEFPTDYDTELEVQSNNIRDPDWVKLFGKEKIVTIADLSHKLETDARMLGWKKLQLALILIVDSVLIAHQQKTRPTLKYVKMVQSVDAFFQHPWGRESFLKTITCMKPPQECKDPIGELVCLLRQDSFRLKGFPLALQLLAFQAVPQLQTIIPAPVDTLSISQLEEPHLPLHSIINYVDILRVEAEQNLAVTSLIQIQSQTQPGWGVWTDVVADERVTYMENLIANHYPFKKHLWPGGDRSGPILIFVPHEEQPAPNRNALKPRKTLKKPSSSRKQRRINNYFPRTGSTRNSNDQVFQMLTKVSTQVSKLRKENKVLRQLIKRRKSRTHNKRSAFHSVICCSKKAHLSHRGCQTDPMVQTTDVPPNKTEDQPQCNSPVVSQYAAQHYGQNTSNSNPLHIPALPQHTSPVHNSPENTSPVHKSPEHTPPIHSSPPTTPMRTPLPPVHNSPENTSPVHRSPEHTPPVHSSPVPNSPQHTSPVHNSPKQTTTIHNSPQHTPSVPPGSKLIAHVRTSPLPASPSGTPPCQEPSSLNNPRYYTSTRKDPQQQLKSITPETSPTKSSSFAEHADSVNAFAATATSKRTSAPILNFDQNQEDCVDVSDSSPARPTPRHQPSDEESLALLVPLPQTQWELFKSTLKRFILMQHMKILMYMLAGRHKEMLHREGLAFTTPHLVSEIQELWKRFKPLRRKDLFQWGKRLTELVLKAGEKWMEDVTTIYTPMIWADKHWVGLAINLYMGYVEIMDPQPSLNKDKKVSTFMEALLTAFPYLVKKVAKPQQTQFRGLEPFYWKRMKDIYINERLGDCGPLSIKFMEFHAHGDPAPHMSGITDIAVDDLRKQYAMDVYKTIVLPAYHAPTFP
ncbi:hypothetical protein Bca52824_063963 [Brassica carinata]|uniref:Ubiquitin-like protease family profile domain-containing protein n=1 Tax=Brassica carinata TaxID=52824 RepID=A0A8X7QGM1_BRACI|nr:hypothetical protein Bca52824_063963 [Brassica carinata]